MSFYSFFSSPTSFLSSRIDIFWVSAFLSFPEAKTPNWSFPTFLQAIKWRRDGTAKKLKENRGFFLFEKKITFTTDYLLKNQ